MIRDVGPVLSRFILPFACFLSCSVGASDRQPSTSSSQQQQESLPQVQREQQQSQRLLQRSQEDFGILIVGDSHGDLEELRKALEIGKEKGATHLLSMGDMSKSSSEEDLRAAYRLLSEHSGLDKEHVFILPGNWEYPANLRGQGDRRLWAEKRKILEEYGQVIAKDFKSFGYLDIGGFKIAAAHVPLHSVPKRFLPDPREELRLFEEATTFTRFEIIPGDLDLALEVFAHTHYPGITPSFFHHPLLNAGTLSSRKSDEIPKTFAFFRPSEGLIEIIDVESAKVVENFRSKGLLPRRPQIRRQGQVLDPEDCRIFFSDFIPQAVHLETLNYR